MQKLWDLNRWQALHVGKNLFFPDQRPRMVRIDFNSPEAVLVYIKTEDEVRFFCRTEGRDTVEFAVNSDFSLLIEEGITYIHIDEGHLTHFEQTDEETFARIHEPRQRNYEQEYMAWKVKDTFNKRMAQMNEMFDIRMKEEANATRQTPAPDGQTIPPETHVGDDTAEND